MNQQAAATGPPPVYIGEDGAGLLGLLRVLVHGTPTVVLDAWDPARAAALVDEHRLNYGVGAPI